MIPYYPPEQCLHHHVFTIPISDRTEPRAIELDRRSSRSRVANIKTLPMSKLSACSARITGITPCWPCPRRIGLRKHPGRLSVYLILWHRVDQIFHLIVVRVSSC